MSCMDWLKWINKMYRIKHIIQKSWMYAINWINWMEKIYWMIEVNWMSQLNQISDQRD